MERVYNMGLWQDIKAEFKKGMAEETQQIENRRDRQVTLMHLTDTLESLTGSRDINPPLKMAIRLMACGVDPKDMQTIDTMGMAYAQGRFNLPDSEPLTEDAFQTALDKINETEGKK